MPFGQLVIGPPGSGKSTYCNAYQQFLKAIGRKVCVVNLDPGNENLPYDVDVDVAELVNVDDVMEALDLGPNGALLYAMEYIEQNLDWLKSKLKKFPDHYLLFDFPGQAELFTHHTSVKRLAQQLQEWNYQVCCVHLVDAHNCSDIHKFISVLLLSLASMVHLELPHVNVLSKADLIEQYGQLPLGLDFFTDAHDLKDLVNLMEQSHWAERHRALTEAICDVVEDYSLVTFSMLSVMDKDSVLNLLKVVDRANGYIYGDLELPKEKSLIDLMMPPAEGSDYLKTASIQENYMSGQQPTGLGIPKPFTEEMAASLHSRLRDGAFSAAGDNEPTVVESPIVERPIQPPTVKPKDSGAASGHAASGSHNSNSSSSSSSGSGGGGGGGGGNGSGSGSSSAENRSSERRCGQCGFKASRDERFKRCGRCKQAWYCDVECQRNAWKLHKIHCSAAQ